VQRRGFIFQSSEIYGGLNGFWDYGPLGAELKRNVKELWWRSMTQQREDVVGLEATIIMHRKSGRPAATPAPSAIRWWIVWDARNDSAQIKSNRKRAPCFITPALGRRKPAGT